VTEGLTVALDMDLAWHYAASEPMRRFLAGVGRSRLEAIRCAACGRRYLPPRPFCGHCRLRMSDWVPVDDVGRLEAWTVVHQPIRDGRSGEMRPSPYGMGLVRLDGADTVLNHYLHPPDAEVLRIGARVEAVWRDERHGAMDDILHFEVVG